MKKERAALEELRLQLQKSDIEVKQSLGQSSSLKAELEQIRAVAATLTQDYAKIRETSREAREDTTAALTTVKEVENKLGPLARLHELSQSTEERLTALNALAEHVSHKAKALDSQQQSVEHAVVQANRVNEMVWAMDVQIGKLNEGMKQIARADDTLARTEKLTAETNAQLEAATKLKVETESETSKLKKEAGSLLDAVRGQVDTLSLKKKEFEAFDLRLRTLHSGVGDAESRMEALTARDKNLIELTQKIDGMTKRVEALFVSADDLTKKQLALESLNERLGQVDDLAKKTSWQLDSLRQSRQDLDALRERNPGVLQVALRSGEAGRQARRRSRRAGGVRRAHDGVRLVGARARGQDGRDPRQAEGGRRRDPEGDAPARIGRRARRADLARQRARAVRRGVRGPAQRAQHAECRPSTTSWTSSWRAAPSSRRSKRSATDWRRR